MAAAPSWSAPPRGAAVYAGMEGRGASAVSRAWVVVTGRCWAFFCKADKTLCERVAPNDRISFATPFQWANLLSAGSPAPLAACAPGCAGRCGGGDPARPRSSVPGRGSAFVVAFVGEGDPSAGSSWARCRSAGLRGCEGGGAEALVQIIGNNVVLQGQRPYGLRFGSEKPLGHLS